MLVAHHVQPTFSSSSSSLGGGRKLNNEYRSLHNRASPIRVRFRTSSFAASSSRWSARASLSSEQRLMLAVLADAINVVQEFGGSSSLRKRNSFNEAWNWFFAKGVACPLSFDSVCDALGIDAEGLRWRLSELVAGRGGTPLRLRLKEASRMQRLTVNRVRRRDPRRVHRATRAPLALRFNRHDLSRREIQNSARGSRIGLPEMPRQFRFDIRPADLVRVVA